MNRSDQKRNLDQVSAEVQTFLTETLRRMDIGATVDILEKEDRIVCDINCRHIERIIGRRGQVIDALQHLVTKFSRKDRFGDDRKSKPFIVDAGGYRDKQMEKLEALAERMGAKALKTGSVIELNPMSAHDRRIIHLTLAEVEGVKTHSEGEGDERHVLIVPT